MFFIRVRIMDFMNKKTKSRLSSLLLVLFTLCVLVVIAMMDSGVQNIEEVLQQLAPMWLVCAGLSILLYYLFDALTHFLTCRLMKQHQSFPSSLLTSMLGIFYNAVTPFAFGGQPIQAIQMKRYGIGTGAASSILVFKFISWQVVTTVLGTIGLIFCGSVIAEGGATMIALFVLGYSLNALCLLLGVVALLKPHWIDAIGKAVQKLLIKIRIFKTPERIEKAQNTWNNFVNDYREAVHFALTHKKAVPTLLLSALATAMAYFTVTYCIYRGLGLNDRSFFYVVLVQAMLTISVSYIPTPGASIASEGGFYLIFSDLFPGATRFPAMLLWRIFTFYANLIFGFIAVVINGISGTPKKKTEKEPS